MPDNDETVVFEGAKLEHIGIKRQSGRYPWGSGDTPQQRSQDFKSYMDEMKSKGLKESEILKQLNDYAAVQGQPLPLVKSPDLRGATSSATQIIFAENQARAVGLAAKGLSNGAIAEAMGLARSAEFNMFVVGWASL